MDKVKVGIPRGLLYYQYFPLWKTFLENLGAEVVLSPKTNKKIVDMGVKSALDETCLPVKVYYGHVSWLKEKVDYLFIPRIISVEVKEYICPKFMGLPDMIKANISNLPKVIDVNLDMSKSNKDLVKFVKEVGNHFTSNPLKITKAWQNAIKENKKYEEIIGQDQMLPHHAIESLLQDKPRGVQPANARLKIAVIGHGYNIYDEYISMDLINKLWERQVQVYTPDLLQMSDINNIVAKLPKRMFWTLGKKCIGGAVHYAKQMKVNGIIHIASFGCGPDSLVGELMTRKVRKETGVPILNITIDEHTGEASLITRLEAYLDMLERRVAL